MRVLDASAIIHGWDNYPLAQFPGLWQWLATEVQQHHLTIPAVAFDEVGHMALECARQFGAQREARKYKIPAVCGMAVVGVANMSFLEYIQKSQQVF